MQGVSLKYLKLIINLEFYRYFKPYSYGINRDEFVFSLSDFVYADYCLSDS